MHRFFIDPSFILNTAVSFPPPVARQIRSVLRLRAGERVLVLDNSGDEMEVLLNGVAKSSVTGEVVAKRPSANEPAAQVTLCLALLKRDNFEWVLQKGTEIGVSRFVPLLTEHAVVTAVKPNKQARWQRILTEAAEQCRRGRIPQLAPPMKLTAAFESVAADRLLLPWVAAPGKTIAASLAESAMHSVALFVGPEGGWSNAEVQIAQAHGAEPVTLGRRTLRAETAAVVAATLTLDALGELDL